jgi:hypothetical protein
MSRKFVILMDSSSLGQVPVADCCGHGNNFLGSI